ncbi:ABC transporter ATP-binding protein/permease [Neisseria shayeganii]|uniref:ABC superfamily ATP binding cassette transporter n=1 Tax=Neisseria shayeganii 871 TaxID=1032488 RepID=G4CJA6_9NEIS|nr:ABC transporter ATP-binding protein/permease [Neisseria shayeganii]EGY52066.1 ABC superfamily ATP binding cassette transporter [Neisseria shayeganii 871]
MNQEKWKIELESTPWWLLESFAGVLLFCLLAALLLGRTRFGRQFARIVRPCLQRPAAAKTAALLLLLLLMVLVEVRISVLNTFFYNGLYSSLQDGAVEAFWFFALINAALMAVKILHTVFNDFLEQVFMIRWLERLNQVLTDHWLAHKNYYRLHMRRHAPDNIDQRIQQDAQDFIVTTVEMVRGLINAVVSVVEFTVILWGLSGVLTLLGVDIPRGMVMFIYLFILGATLASVWIGRPLVGLNFQNERLNGDYRYALVRVRDHAESIAFYGGEAAERDNLRRHFARIIRNRWRIVYRSLGLNGFNTGITQISNLLPLMLQAPRFFAGEVKIGDMHQTVQAFNRLQRALSFFRNTYEAFTAYQARVERLAGFLCHTAHQDPVRLPQTETARGVLSAEGLTLYRSDGGILLADIGFQVADGDALLIQGPSGCGKTSLLRALAGLWPFGSSGRIRSPAHGHTLFVPQHPYMPQGTLRQALCYPDLQPDDAALHRAMDGCRLGYLKSCLDRENDWQHKLSPGELQRAAFVRIVLGRPQLVLLDEATSALDEETEAALYRLIRKELADSMIVSIGHRSSLNAFHNKVVCIGEAACT